MILVSRFLLYRKGPEADRWFFRDEPGFRSIDVAEGRLVFAMPPAEAGIHSLDGEFSQSHAGHPRMAVVLYLMCDDLDAQIEFRKSRNVHCTGMQLAPWGRATTIPLPSGGRPAPYQPLPVTAFNLNSH